MDLGSLLPWLASLHPIVPVVLAALGCLVVLGQTVVALTPSAADDALASKLEALPLVGPLLKALASFAPIQRK